MKSFVSSSRLGHNTADCQ